MDAALDGFQAGMDYSLVIHRLGDLTRGAESTGEARGLRGSEGILIAPPVALPRNPLGLP